MPKPKRPALIEQLESRRLLTTWSPYAKLVSQDIAANNFSGVTGKGVTIAMIDTGIDYNLPILGGGFGKGHKVIGGYDFFDNDTDPMDEDGHGTDTASVVAANPFTVNGITYQGVAPDANLVALRVGTETDISDDNIARALQWVIDEDKSKAFNISVVNISLGSGNYTTAQTNSQLSPLFQTLHDMGVFVTAASGNSNDQQSGPISQDGIAYPAADPSVFAVGAVDSNDVITTWSQRGSELDLLAPGVSIEMPTLQGGFTTEDGTSFASPYVAGTAALIHQEDPKVSAGDVGSILMASGTENRDGDAETGNTTGLLFSRLNIASALTLTMQREGHSSTLPTGTIFDTALDSNGVLYGVYYNSDTGDLLYATRNNAGLWSKTQVIDTGNVGTQLSIAVDDSGKVGIGYFDATNTAVKFAEFTGTKWDITTVESDKNVGTSPSLGFDVDGNAYLGYYRKSGGDLRLAILDRDTNKWTRQTVDTSGDNVGKDLSLEVGERSVFHNFGFTTYDTSVAIAYSDTTNNSLKYARLDLQDGSGWFINTIDSSGPVGNISFQLHVGPAGTGAGDEAQVAYQDQSTADVKYAYFLNAWNVETVASTGKLGDTVQLYFDTDNTPIVTYYDRVRRALYTATRQGVNSWSSVRASASSGPESASLNDRTGDVLLTILDRPRTDASSTEVI
jgi:subtilisin family serine protease